MTLVFAPPASVPGAAHLTRTASWAALATFAAFLLVGLVAKAGEHPARATAGALIALAAAVPLFLLRTRLTLGLAAVAAAGAVLIGNGDSRVISWMLVIVLAAWCLLAGGIAAGLVFGVAGILLFGGERPAHRPGTRGAQPDRAGPHQPRDRPAPVRRGGHGQDPYQPRVHPGCTWATAPRRSSSRTTTTSTTRVAPHRPGSHHRLNRKPGPRGAGWCMPASVARGRPACFPRGRGREWDTNLGYSRVT